MTISIRLTFLCTSSNSKISKISVRNDFVFSGFFVRKVAFCSVLSAKGLENVVRAAQGDSVSEADELEELWSWCQLQLSSHQRDRVTAAGDLWSWCQLQLAQAQSCHQLLDQPPDHQPPDHPPSDHPEFQACRCRKGGLSGISWMLCNRL